MADSTSARRALAKELQSLRRDTEHLRQSYGVLFGMRDEVREAIRDAMAKNPQAQFYSLCPELSAIVANNRKSSAALICKRFDEEGLRLPDNWGEFKVTSWAGAYRQRALHNRIDAMISKDRRKLR